jgi:hypothetical protein
MDAAIANYKNTPAFIEYTHRLLVTALLDHVKIDTRVGRGDKGIYHEPLERLLEYLGVSMSADQVVNTSIDGNATTRVLIPSHPCNTKHWCDKFKLEQHVLLN